MKTSMIKILSYLSKYILICLALSLPRYVSLTNVFTSDTELFHITVYNQSVYAGAKNVIFKLNSNLAEIRRIKTGPVQDNRMCYGDYDDCLLNTTNNYNKILLVHRDRTGTPFLVTCGSVFQGICQIRDLNLLTVIKENNVEYVSTNEKDASTVAFIARGPIDKASNLKYLLYVGVTLRDRPNILYSQKLPAVSSRIIDTSKSKELFKATKRTNLQFLEIKKNKYFVDYIYGFSFSGFSYFLTVQPLGIERTKFHSKIVRICQNSGYTTYTEIPLQCNDVNGNNYNLLVSAYFIKLSGNAAKIMKANQNGGLIVGVFGKSKGPGKIQSGKYAVCSFLLKEINKKFDDNIHKCITEGLPADGGLPWVDQPKTQLCQIKVSKINISCSITKELRGFAQGGNIPVVSNSNMTNITSSSITALTYPRGLVLYMGTKLGKLLKYSVLSPTQTYKFGEEAIDTGNEIKKIEVGPDESYIYILSKHKITKRPIKDCDKRLTCLDCLNGPYCGWCTLEKKCSLKSDCQFVADPLHFVNESASKCPRIISVSPDPTALSVWIRGKVKMNIVNLPTLTNGKSYVCDFGGKTVPTKINGDEFSCKAPPSKDIPGFADDKVSLDIDLKLKASDIGKNFIETKVIFYNCRAFASCLKCTRSKHKCNWCSQLLSCFDDGAKECQSGIIQHGGPLQSITASQCPSLSATITKFIPKDAYRSLKVKGINFPDAVGQYKYQCKVSHGAETFIAAGEKINSKEILCSKRKYTYSDKKMNVTAAVDVSFGGRPFDISNSLKVMLYDCSYKRDDCSICLDSHADWDCGWCDGQSKGKCTVHDFCPTSTTWRNNTCPSPMINEFHPSTGSIYGGTTVIMKGSDLGTTVSDVINVTVAGVNCKLIKNEYIASKQVVCITNATTTNKGGKVVIYIRFSRVIVVRGMSPTDFHFWVPQVGRFEPTQAPCSGGTKIKVYGSHMNVGRSIKVKAAGKKCDLTKKTDDLLECTLISSCTKRRRRQLADGTIEVIFDGHPIPSSSNQKFEFKQDPTVDEVNTNKKSTPVQTFKSGGHEFFVTGRRFKLIQKPKMKFIIYGKGITVKQNCTTISDIKMICITPNISKEVGNINHTTVGVGFIMQNVPGVRFWGNITIREDPVFYHFKGVKNLKTNDLILEGENFDMLSKKDVNVTVGGLPCEITSVGESLVCTAPQEDQVKALNGKNLVVIVSVGKGGPTYILGSLKYDKAAIEEFPLLYVAIAAGGGFILLVVIVILVVLYRRRNKKEKRYHKIHQMQLDNIEARYARECKEAFAELQTEITDLTTDLGTSVVPYLNFESYAMRVLFPGIDIHPVMEKDCNKSDSWKRCMSSLCDLMKQKEFLLVFIKTLEGQPSFVMRDRCKFASLLMVTLQDDIKYITDVLQELLSDLIERSVEAGRAKLLLRRTESVAEKLLTNWLAYSLHQYLEGRVGDPLYRLFSAIGALLDKEPVDAITCEARNSLSEDRLLRQKVDFQTVGAQVEYDEGTVQVNLLNCDTINQGKEKILNLIYKNSPYSQRPNKDTLVLAYVTPNGGEKILHEEDSTSEHEGTDWKKLNTLEHYLIPDGCQLKLVPFTMYSDGTGTPVFHDSSIPSVIFIPNQSSTPMLNSHHHHHDQPRLWHLAKAQDYPVDHKEDVRQSKMMAEVYLARLLKTKGTLQNFVDDLFNAIFIIPKQTKKGSAIPPAMKFLFDFLDKEAGLLGVNDSETLHTWKNNSLPLRFWINIIKNPNFVFDVYKSNTVDSCLSVIAQLFMDSCSPDEHRLGKDSPSNKLLYAKEIPEYKKMVARFYSEVKALPPVTDREMNETLSEISKKFGDTFNRYNAASEMMSYAMKYKSKIMDALEDADLPHFCEELQAIMDSLPDE